MPLLMSVDGLEKVSITHADGPYSNFHTGIYKSSDDGTLKKDVTGYYIFLAL